MRLQKDFEPILLGIIERFRDKFCRFWRSSQPFNFEGVMWHFSLCKRSIRIVNWNSWTSTYVALKVRGHNLIKFARFFSNFDQISTLVCNFTIIMTQHLELAFCGPTKLVLPSCANVIKTVLIWNHQVERYKEKCLPGKFQTWVKI